MCHCGPMTALLRIRKSDRQLSWGTPGAIQ